MTSHLLMLLSILHPICKIPEKAFFKHSNKSSCSKTLINPSFEAHYLLCNTLYFLCINGKFLNYTYAISNSCTFYRDRKSTRLNSQSRFDLVCRLLLEKKKLHF